MDNMPGATERPIPTALSELEEAIEQLSGSIVELDGRLAPLLRSEPTTGAKAEQPPDATCELIEIVKRRIQSVNHCTHDIRSMVERLQI